MSIIPTNSTRSARTNCVSNQVYVSLLTWSSPALRRLMKWAAPSKRAPTMNSLSRAITAKPAGGKSASPHLVQKLNGTRSIRNPLAGLSKSQLLQEAEDFAEQHGLSDQVAHFRRAALAAQKPDDSNSIPELLESDRAALVTEKHHRWKHPKALYFTILMNSISAAVQGWDQTGSNGANLSYPEAFGIADFGDACEASGTCSRNSWIIGAINSAPYMAICLVLVHGSLLVLCGRPRNADVSRPARGSPIRSTSIVADATSSSSVQSSVSRHQSGKPCPKAGYRS